MYSLYHVIGLIAAADTATLAKRFGALSFLLCAGLPLVTIGPLHAETLQDALLSAYRSNPTLNAQRSNELATGTNLPRTQAGSQPKVTATGDIGHHSETDKYPDGTESGLVTNPRGAALNIDQNLFDGFRTTNSVRQAGSQIRAAEAATRTIEQETLFAAVTAYM